MSLFNISVIVLILTGAAIMLLSVRKTKDIFSIIQKPQQTVAWIRLSYLMIFFFIGYLVAAALVFFNQSELVSSLTGLIFLGGSAFVYLVVRQSIITLNALKEANNHLEQRVAERTTQLEEKSQQLTEKNKELEQFVYITSHDLKQPINTIQNMAKVIEEDNQEHLDDLSKEDFKSIYKAIDRMIALINGLLDLSRIGKQRKLELLDVNKIVDNVQSDLKSLINSKNAKISSEQLPSIMGSSLEIRLLFQNLINNAIKFTPENKIPEIHISAEENDKHIKFKVKDNGIGIKEHDFKRIFDFFGRIDTSIEGTGIGLSHCQKIVTTHGGTLGVNSEFGEGSTFHFTIPKQATTLLVES